MMSDSLLNSPPLPPFRTSKIVNLGGVKAVVLFAVILVAYVVQSQLTQYVQADLGYKQPYFLFYVAHSTFIVIFPLHLLFLVKTTNVSSSQLLSGLWIALAQQLDPNYPISFLNGPTRRRFPFAKLLFLISWTTAVVTFTAVLWYVAVSFAPIADVTAIFNTNAFWAYLLSVQFNEHQLVNHGSQRKWQPKKLFAVLLACLGVLAVVYGGSQPQPPENPPESSASSSTESATLPNDGFRSLIGDVLTLISSISYATYQVLYKKYAALPSPHPSSNVITSSPSSEDPSTLEYAYEPLPATTERVAPSSPTVQIFTPSPRITTHILPRSGSISSFRYLAPAIPEETEGELQPVSPPFAFHPNFLTSLIGLMTLLVLWIPLPFLAYYAAKESGGLYTGTLSAVKGILPPDRKTWFYVMMIALNGVVYNGGFMVLLGLWGAVTTSVGNLLTIVLVLFSDSILFGNTENVTMWSILGSAAIVCAFMVLAMEMTKGI